jgi:phage/conjugal plasmid C-4 type zinc finger TraR family protein
MGDIIDRASEHETRHRDIALAQVARAQLHGESATHCQRPDCGEEIPQERRVALPGVQHCITCAELIEKKNKRPKK